MKRSHFRPVPGQIEVFGDSARPRTVAALCAAPDLRCFALTGKDLAAVAADTSTASFLSGLDLIEAVPLPGIKATGDPQKWPICSDLLKAWDSAAFRLTAEGTHLIGVLSGVRSVVGLRTGNRVVRARSLLQIDFDEVSPEGHVTPDLGRGDLGRLVNFSSGSACALLVAGSGLMGYAVPLMPVLEELGLRLWRVPPVASKVDLGLRFIASDISRSVSFDLGDPPMQEAA